MKNGKIELLRFLFAVGIVFYHSYWSLGSIEKLVPAGYFGVEFFFIVSGYLMMATIERRSSGTVPEPIGKETARFLGRKIAVVYPEVVIAWIIGVLVTSFAI